MRWDRIVGGFSRRRGFGRAALLLLTVAAVVVAGCGKSGQGAETDPEKGSDAEFLNAALAQELTLLDAYAKATPRLGDSLRPFGRRFRAHQQEYADAIAKAIRGLGGEDEAEPVEPDVAGIENQTELLALLYELEGAALNAYLEASPRLFTPAPRTLAASLAAGHAQHLVVLRQALGVPLVDADPEAFESGEEPPPLDAAPEAEDGRTTGGE